MALGLLGAIGLTVAVMALIEVKALKRSTHKIEWVPIDQKEPSLNDKPSISNDNSPIDDFTDDDLFADDIELYLDKKKSRRKE